MKRIRNRELVPPRLLPGERVRVGEPVGRADERGLGVEVVGGLLPARGVGRHGGGKGRVQAVGVEALGGGEVAGGVERDGVELAEAAVEVLRGRGEVRVEEVDEVDEVGRGGDVLLDEVGGFVGVGLGGG